MSREVPMPERAHLPPVLTTEDLATLLDLPSHRSALDFIREHRLPFVLLGRKKYVLRDSLIAHLKSLETVPRPREEIEKEAARMIDAVLPRARSRQEPA